MSTTTTNFGWTVPSDTDLVKDGAAAIRTALGGVDTSFVDLKGGTTGQVLSKASGTDLDFTWVAQDDSNAIQNAIVDAKGDLIAATAADTPARLAVGTNGQVLTADSAESTGMKWADPATGGGGLTLITKSSFTSSTAVNVDSVFSSTYKDYRIVFDFTSSTTEVVNVRFRSGGSTYTGNTYEWRITSVAVGNESGIFTYMKIGQNGTSRFGAQLELSSPYVTGYTTWTLASTGLSTGAGAATYVGGGWNDTSRSEDGIQLYGANGGSLTGQILVYGYKES